VMVAVGEMDSLLNGRTVSREKPRIVPRVKKLRAQSDHPKQF
jgi:hypothetical protein